MNRVRQQAATYTPDRDCSRNHEPRASGAVKELSGGLYAHIQSRARDQVLQEYLKSTFSRAAALAAYEYEAEISRRLTRWLMPTSA